MSQPWQTQNINSQVHNFNEVSRALAMLNKNFGGVVLKTDDMLKGVQSVANGPGISVSGTMNVTITLKRWRQWVGV